MSDGADTPWRGRLRFSSPTPLDARGDTPLSEAERDALEGWMPKGAHILAHMRSSVGHEGHSIWAFTGEGVLVATLTDEGRGRLRARARWVSLSLLRRVDLLRGGGKALVRIATLSRRFVLNGVDEDCATRFAALVRASILPAPRLQR